MHGGVRSCITTFTSNEKHRSHPTQPLKAGGECKTLQRRAAQRFLLLVFLPLSSGVTNPIGRLGGSGGVISSRSASNTCLS